MDRETAVTLWHKAGRDVELFASMIEAAERERWATCTANLMDAVNTCLDIAPGCAIDDFVKDARRLLGPNV